MPKPAWKFWSEYGDSVLLIFVWTSSHASGLRLWGPSCWIGGLSLMVGEGRRKPESILSQDSSCAVGGVDCAWRGFMCGRGSHSIESCGSLATAGISPGFWYGATFKFKGLVGLWKMLHVREFGASDLLVLCCHFSVDLRYQRLIVSRGECSITLQSHLHPCLGCLIDVIDFSKSSSCPPTRSSWPYRIIASQSCSTHSIAGKSGGCP